MLKYSINKNKEKLRYDVIAASDFVQYDGERLNFVVNNYGSIFTNDIISFYRKDGGAIEHYAEKIVNNVENNTKIETFPFENIELKIISADTKTINGINYIIFTFNKSLNAEINREGQNIKTGNIVEEDLCVGDIFVKDDYFFYEKTQDGVENANVKCNLFWTESSSQNVPYFIEGLIPCNVGGIDLGNMLIFESNSTVRKLAVNADIFNFWVKDLRFFAYSASSIYADLNVWDITLKPGTSVMIRRGDSILSLPIDRSFSPYLLANDGISQFLESEAEKRINKSLDYEKQQFIPVVKNNEKYLDVNKITFRVHLRKRDDDFNVIPDGYWNAYERGGIIYPYYSGDTIIENGIFSIDDVYYQRKCVSESFLRLSYYDSMSRGEQKLLYTAKIHLNENKLWTNYINDKALFLEFFCSNKFDVNEKTEGFYLHMFPGNIKELEEDGAAIYLKIEFCYAKLGKIIPLTLPVYPNGIIKMNEGVEEFIPYDPAFHGKTYLKTDSSGKSYTDMNELNNDMYIKVRLNYDVNKNRYVWYFNGANKEKDAEELNLILYEPKIF